MDAFSELSVAEKRATQSFMALGEQSILSLRDKEADYQTAYLGNLLRDAAVEGAVQLKSESDRVLAPAREYLFRVIGMPDAQLVDAARKEARP